MQHRLMIGAILVVMAAASAATDDESLNREISALLAESASISTARDQALALVNDALEFNPQSSDALYLRALLLRPDQSATRDVIEDLSDALEFDQFASVDRAAASSLLAQVLLRTGRPGEALAVLQEADLSRPDTDPEVLAQTLFTRVRASRALTLSSAGQILATARRRFPNDARFFLLELEAEDAPSYRYRRELERLMRTSPNDPYLDDCLLAYGRSAPVEGENAWAYEQYRQMGGSDPAAVPAVAANPAYDASSEFLQLNGLVRRDAFLALLDLESVVLSDELIAAAEAFTGESVVDANGDGFAEERFTLESGLVTRWQVDANQDGESEMDLFMSDGEPVSLSMLQDDREYSLLYEVYPAVGRVDELLPTGMRRYVLRPNAFELRVIDRLPAGGLQLDSVFDTGSFTGLDLAAAQIVTDEIQEIGADGLVRERAVLLDGQVVRVSRDVNTDGAPDELVLYSGGLPESSLTDIDFDGYFEVARTYVQGREADMVVDEDDNGVPDVVETIDDPASRTWDLNQDGEMDVLEFGIFSDSIVREFPLLEQSP